MNPQWDDTVKLAGSKLKGVTEIVIKLKDANTFRDKPLGQVSQFVPPSCVCVYKRAEPTPCGAFLPGHFGAGSARQLWQPCICLDPHCQSEQNEDGGQGGPARHLHVQGWEPAVLNRARELIIKPCPSPSTSTR